MGLANIKKCADSMKLESQVGVGTRLEIVIYLRPQTNNHVHSVQQEREAKEQP
jgi:anti-sigma regulatory factor (Ser/Thr protein kinase)